MAELSDEQIEAAEKAFRAWWGNDEQSNDTRLSNAAWFAALHWAAERAGRAEVEWRPAL